ncbi:MAG: hypothetical protein CL772_05105 [Chloroflexi bacterium]|nr:hypothetical protein [Chloroflexota bacterium]
MESFFQFAALISAFTWTTSGVILKKINFNRYFSFPFYEALISLSIMVIIITFIQEWSAIFNEKPLDLAMFSIAALLSCIGTVFYVISLKNNPMGVTFTLCAVSTILMSLTLDFAINNVNYSIAVFIGALIVLISIFIINFQSFREFENKSLLGILGGVFAGSLWGIAVFFNDKALIESSILTGAIVRAVISVIALGILSEIMRQRLETTSNIKEVSKVLIAGSLITFSSLLWFLSLNTITGSLTTIFGNTAPVFAILLGFFFLNEKIHKSEILGIFLAFIGIVIIIISKT